MSDTNLRTNSSIELSDIRKLDILLTQCESSSCENICIDCCAKLGSVEDDDDGGDNLNDENASGASDSLIITMATTGKDSKGILSIFQSDETLCVCTAFLVAALVICRLSEWALDERTIRIRM